MGVLVRVVRRELSFGDWDCWHEQVVRVCLSGSIERGGSMAPVVIDTQPASAPLTGSVGDPRWVKSPPAVVTCISWGG